LQPVLELTDVEKSKVQTFCNIYSLNKYEQVVLFEFAPQSGQSTLTKENSLSIADKLTSMGNVAVIMSSAQKIHHSNKAIIDGSILSIRETAALTHYCSFLLGTSSGITWISTATGAKQLPMIQLLNSNAKWVNPISRDFERFGFDKSTVIELIVFDETIIFSAIQLAFKDFASAKKEFNQTIPLHFFTTRSIVYNLLCYMQFKAIFNHLKLHRKVYGNNVEFYKQFILGCLDLPFKLVMNFWKKKMRIKK
jgi:hypothetical protein